MKKLVLILIPLLIIGGVIGAALMGIINIPGLTPKKADWKGTLTKIFKDHKGTIKGDTVTLKGLPKADMEAFLAAAKAGSLEPQPNKDNVKSAKLVAFLTAPDPNAPKPKVATKPKTVNAPPATAVAKKKKPETIIKPEQGIAAVAELWNSVEVPKLLAITEKYKTPDLAKILLQMDQDHVSEFLSALKPEKAAALSAEIQKQASIVPTPEPAKA